MITLRDILRYSIFNPNIVLDAHRIVDNIAKTIINARMRKVFKRDGDNYVCLLCGIEFTRDGLYKHLMTTHRYELTNMFADILLRFRQVEIKNSKSRTLVRVYTVPKQYVDKIRDVAEKLNTSMTRLVLWGLETYSDELIGQVLSRAMNGREYSHITLKMRRDHNHKIVELAKKYGVARSNIVSAVVYIIITRYEYISRYTRRSADIWSYVFDASSVLLPTWTVGIEKLTILPEK